MTGFLNWFERKAKGKLRFSQIRVLYQNNAALDFLEREFGALGDLGYTSSHGISEALAACRQVTDDAIIALSYSDILSDDAAATMIQVNGSLKNIYAGFIDGKRSHRESVGGNNEGLTAFSDRFLPASGWEGFSDLEWNSILSGAIGRLNQ